MEAAQYDKTSFLPSSNSFSVLGDDKYEPIVLVLKRLEIDYRKKEKKCVCTFLDYLTDFSQGFIVFFNNYFLLLYLGFPPLSNP